MGKGHGYNGELLRCILHNMVSPSSYLLLMHAVDTALYIVCYKTDLKIHKVSFVYKHITNT